MRRPVVDFYHLFDEEELFFPIRILLIVKKIRFKIGFATVLRHKVGVATVLQHKIGIATVIRSKVQG